MKFAIEIAARIPTARVIGDPNTLIRGVTHDSRCVAREYLFGVLRGAAADGRAFVPDAVSRGASALLVEEPLDVPLTQIVVDNVRRALGTAAAACYDYPTTKLALIGITGTNGKTTIVYLVESALRALGKRPGIMSTVAYRFENMVWDAGFTTPEASVIQSTAAKMVEAGATHLIMESSSHGIAQHRLNGCRYEVAAFTNLTQDHLDYHKTMEAYGKEKLRLFTEFLPKNPNGRGVVNLDDPFSLTILKNTVQPVLTVSVHHDATADLRPASMPQYSIAGIAADIVTPSGIHKLVSPLLGPHNLNNLLVALGICLQLGERAADVFPALNGCGAPGRLERVSEKGDPTILVDYAHTPDALSNVLSALRPLTAGRLICVFGCGGDRDNTKRPLMGRAVRDAADLAIVTSDNPRTEQPDAIIEMILPGMEDGHWSRLEIDALDGQARGYAVEADRKHAITSAVLAAEVTDTVLIAGKGHEDYQILGTTKIHFDDRETARQALALRKKGA